MHKALSLRSEAAERIAAGAPVVDFALLEDPGLAAEPGRPLLFLDPRGGVLGSGVADPENEVLRILAREAVPSFDLYFFKRKVAAAYALRQALGLVDGKSAYRLLNAEGDGLSGFVADVYAAYVVLNLISFMVNPPPGEPPPLLFMLLYAAVAIGVTTGGALHLHRNRDRLS